MALYPLYGGPELLGSGVAANDLFPVYDTSGIGLVKNKTISASSLGGAFNLVDTGLVSHLANYNNPHQTTFNQLNTGVSYGTGVVSATNFSGQYTSSPNYLAFKTSDYTVTTGDHGKKLVFSGVGLTAYLPQGLPPGFSCYFSNEATGKLFFTGSGVSLLSYSGISFISGQYGYAFLWRKSNNVYRLDGVF